MDKHTTATPKHQWQDSSHASLCALGCYLRTINFFKPLEEGVTLHQKVVKYTPVQKVEMLLVRFLMGAKAVSHTATDLRPDRALLRAFGLPGCADQSVLADTLNAATEADVSALAQALATIFDQHSLVTQHDFTQAILVIDIDLSPLPASKHAEGSERGYMGRCRSKTGRKLVRVRVASTQETMWEQVVGGRAVETLAVLQQAVAALEARLGIAEDTPQAAAKRAQIEIRLDSGWGSDACITWVVARGYQVTGKFKSTARVQKLVRGITAWQPTSSPGREVAAVPVPVEFGRALHQYAVRTPSKERVSGYYHAVVFTSRTDLTMEQVVEDYDQRAGMEAGLKADKQGLGLVTIRKRRLAAQKMVVLLVQLAHNLLIWSRQWLSAAAVRLARYGIVRLVREIWAIPGRVKLGDQTVPTIRLRAAHPRARDVCRGFARLLAESETRLVLG